MNCFVFTFLPLGEVANSRVVGMEHVAKSLSFFARDCLHSSSSKRAFRMVAEWRSLGFEFMHSTAHNATTCKLRDTCFALGLASFMCRRC